MLHGKVIGTATSSIKHPSLEGWKLLVVQPYGGDGTSPDGDPLLAVDVLGAGIGASVFITGDRHATRQLLGSDTTPVRWSVLGIDDA